MSDWEGTAWAAFFGLLVVFILVMSQAAQATEERVACILEPYEVVETRVPEPFAATYTWPTRVIHVDPEYRWDAGVMYHEIGHHFYFECLANEHPYWHDKPERFADAWAEYRLGYDVPYYLVPRIDALWMEWWSDLRTFDWRTTP